ncbi:hypothetical protein ACE1SV_61760 [Streptomyces sennicomposti]
MVQEPIPGPLMQQRQVGAEGGGGPELGAAPSATRMDTSVLPAPVADTNSARVPGRRGRRGPRRTWRGAEEGARLSCMLRAAGIARVGEDLLLQAVHAVGFVAGSGGYVAALGDEATVDRGFRKHGGFGHHARHPTAQL